VKGIEIPKPQGGIRLLGIPTVKDRLVQQAILEILTPMYDKTFSDNSYGFRFKRSAHQALAKACQNVKDGYTIIVDIVLAKFFDEVNHHRLIWMLGTRIGDKRVLRLINLFLKTGIFLEGMESQRIKGTPQGRSLKPLIIQYCT
jgi:RNA-directed DNA polymerase